MQLKQLLFLPIILATLNISIAKEKKPINILDKEMRGNATWYNMAGRIGSSGQRIKKTAFTAAIRQPKDGEQYRGLLNKLVKVVHIRIEKTTKKIIRIDSIYVYTNDHLGRHAKAHVDLNKCAAEHLGIRRAGRVEALYTVYGDPGDALRELKNIIASSEPLVSVRATFNYNSLPKKDLWTFIAELEK